MNIGYAVAIERWPKVRFFVDIDIDFVAVSSAAGVAAGAAATTDNAAAAASASVLAWVSSSASPREAQKQTRVYSTGGTNMYITEFGYCASPHSLLDLQATYPT